MSERTVKVRCKEVRKHMKLTLQSFDEFKETIRTRLNLDTEEMSIEAILDGDDEEYNLSNDGDLQDAWQGLKELRITPNWSERLKQTTVEIDEVEYRLDVPMAEDSPIVQHCAKGLCLPNFTKQTKAMMARVGLSYIATVASGNSKLVIGMNDICFSTRQMCCATRVLMSGYERTSHQVLETFQCMIFHLSQNHSADALMSFATVKEFVHQSRDDTTNLIKKIEKVQQQINAFRNETVVVSNEIVQEQSRVTDKKRAAERELKQKEERMLKLKAAVADTEEREKVRKEEGAKMVERTHVSGAVGITGFGAAVYLAGATASVVAPPFFLFTGILGTAAYTLFKYKGNALGEEGELNRKQLHEKSEEKEQVEQKITEVDTRLRELGRGVDSANNLKQCLWSIEYLTRIMLNAFQDLSNDWGMMEEACRVITTSHHKEMEHACENDCSKITENYTFKRRVVLYYAKWVALKVFARQCNEMLEAVLKTFDDRTRYTTREEAEARLPTCLRAAENEGLLQITE